MRVFSFLTLVKNMVSLGVFVLLVGYSSWMWVIIIPGCAWVPDPGSMFHFMLCVCIQRALSWCLLSLGFPWSSLNWFFWPGQCRVGRYIF